MCVRAYVSDVVLKFVDLFIYFFLPRQCLRLQMDATLHNVCVSLETRGIFFFFKGID